jgi:uncharacterized membrane protein
MIWLLPIHILGGLTGLISGGVALFTRKGGRLHRRSGLVFVYGMLALALSGAAMAILQGQIVNVMAGGLTFYLVSTGLLTVHRPAKNASWISAGALALGLAVAAGGIGLGLMAAGFPEGSADADLGGIGFVFGGVALLGALGDARVLLARRQPETQRIARHVWRMSFALFIAAGSFFLGQADVIPEPLRIRPLLAMPVLLVLGLMVYWLVRVLLLRWRPNYSEARLA